MKLGETEQLQLGDTLRRRDAEVAALKRRVAKLLRALRIADACELNGIDWLRDMVAETLAADARAAKKGRAR